jgi:hypothetical protein
MLLRRGLALFFTASMQVLVASCGGSQQPPPTIGDDAAARTGAPEGWPSVLIVSAGSGPALFLGPENDSPAIGYVSGGVRVRLDGPPRNGRVPVTVSGGLSARGWMPLTRVGAYTTRRGRIEGTPTYVGVGDLVSFVDRGGDGSFQVQIAPWLGRAENDRLGPWQGTLPADWLSDSRPEGADTGLNPGENRALPAGQEVQVFDRPGGRVIATLPATTPPLTVVVLRSRDGWNGIRAGVGPYLVGYIEGELQPADAPPRATWTPPARAAGEMPARIAEEEEGDLFRIRSGARIRFLDRVVARVRGEGWARRIGTVEPNQVDVYVAVDEGSAIRGLVRDRDLTPAESAAGSSATEDEEDAAGAAPDAAQTPAPAPAPAAAPGT